MKSTRLSGGVEAVRKDTVTTIWTMLVFPFSWLLHAKITWRATAAVKRKGIKSLAVYVMRATVAIRTYDVAWRHSSALALMIRIELLTPGHYTRGAIAQARAARADRKGNVKPFRGRNKP